MKSQMTSKEERATRSDEKPASTEKTSTKKSKNMKLQTKEAGKPIAIVQGRKKTSSLKSKDEQAKVSSSCSTQSSRAQDGTTSFFSASTSKQEEIVMKDSH